MNRLNKIMFSCATLVAILLSAASCQKDFLKEVPVSSLSNEIVLTSADGFEYYITTLHYQAREQLAGNDLRRFGDMFYGTDIFCAGQIGEKFFRDYESFVTPSTDTPVWTWNWAYKGILPTSNLIIDNAESEDLAGIWKSEEERNAIIAEAKFFRAWVHNILANLYGGVPIIDHYITTPKTDFVRASRQEVYEFCAKDLEFASKWLPTEVSGNKEGRIVKAAADHLLSEVYVSLGEYDKAIKSASNVIDCGLYELMKVRFGANAKEAGDVFSDLFIDGNQNRSSGNRESIWVWQYEEYTPGGRGSTWKGNQMPRLVLPFMVRLTDPDGKLGMSLQVDSLLRGVAAMRPCTYLLYDIWGDDFDKDMRNSKYNIKREFYYNNEASNYFGQKVEPKKTLRDTMEFIYPYPRKVEGHAFEDIENGGATAKDFIVYRLAETYLLRAEAYLRKGDLVNAAKDINEVRTRANASEITASDVTLDYILDERARELMCEEPRRLTLCRTGKLVERVKKYNMLQTTRESIKDKHNLYPIPQSAIDANFSAKLEQNPGYDE